MMVSERDRAMPAAAGACRPSWPDSMPRLAVLATFAVLHINTLRPLGRWPSRRQLSQRGWRRCPSCGACVAQASFHPWRFVPCAGMPRRQTRAGRRSVLCGKPLFKLAGEARSRSRICCSGLCGQCSSRRRVHRVDVVVLELGHDGHRSKRREADEQLHRLGDVDRMARARYETPMADFSLSNDVVKRTCDRDDELLLVKLKIRQVMHGQPCGPRGNFRTQT